MLFLLPFCIPYVFGILAEYKFDDLSNQTLIRDSSHRQPSLDGFAEACLPAGRPYTHTEKKKLLVGHATGIRFYGHHKCATIIPHNDAFNTPYMTASAWFNWFWGSDRAIVMRKDSRFQIRFYRQYLEVELWLCKASYTKDLFCHHHQDQERMEAILYPYNKGFCASGEWCHVAFSFSSSLVQVFLNGNVVFAAPTNGTRLRGIEASHINQHDLQAHKYALTFGTLVSGWLADVRIEDFAQPASKVQQHYDSTKHIYAQTPFQIPSSAEIKYYNRGWREDVVNSTNRVLFNGWLQNSPPKNNEKKIATVLYPLRINGIHVKTAFDEMSTSFDVLQRLSDWFAIEHVGFEIVDDLCEKCTDESFTVTEKAKKLLIQAISSKGLLYGGWHVIRAMKSGNREKLNLYQTVTPNAKIRVLDHWSYFRGERKDLWMSWTDNRYQAHSRADSVFSWNDLKNGRLERVTQWARLLSSVGVNGLAPTDPDFQHENEFSILSRLNETAILADILRPFNIRLFWTFDFVLAQNKTAIAQLLLKIPDFGGFVLKIGSEEQGGNPSPQVVNSCANYLKQLNKNGVILLRAFIYGFGVYGNQPRIVIPKHYFKPFDGQYSENVYIIGKYCPLDFETHEEINALDGALAKTNYGVEFMVGKGFPMSWFATWQNWYTFNNGYNNHLNSNGQSLNYASVSAVLGDTILAPRSSWTAHPMNMINFYVFGRLAMDPTLDKDQIYDEWINLTFNSPSKFVVSTIRDILVRSEAIASNAMIYHGYRGVWFNFDGEQLRANPLETMLINQTHIGSLGRQNGVLDAYSPAVKALYSNYRNPASEKSLLVWDRFPYTYVLNNNRTILEDIRFCANQSVVELDQIAHLWSQLNGLLDAEYYRVVLDGYAFWRTKLVGHRNRVLKAFQHMH